VIKVLKSDKHRQTYNGANTTKILHNTTMQVISLVTKTDRSFKNYVIISFPVWCSLKLVGLINKCQNKNFCGVQVGKYLSEIFPIKNGETRRCLTATASQPCL